MATKNKFPEWGRTEDGTEVRLCPLEKTDEKPLYCSRDGAFLLASVATRRVAFPTDHREPTSTTRHTAVSHALSFSGTLKRVYIGECRHGTANYCGMACMASE